MTKFKDKRVPQVKESPALREIKAGGTPGAKTIRAGGSPESAQKSSDTKTPAWQFRCMDETHADWGWKNIPPTDWRDVLSHLRSFEGMTWAAIQDAAGGRAHGNNSHPLPVTKLVNAAQKRMIELGLEEIDEVFSLRLTNTLRIYGVRDERVLRIIWRDPHHGTRRGAYPKAK